MSTPHIQQLDSHVIDHIAAGEVVERPASVVKELLENAYDAGASLVQVELERGGLGRITITDDGHGMRPQDAKQCILRHATSKLRSAADLFRISTLGFRGEALSSIAAIAKVTITTRTKDALEGFRLVVHGGKLISAMATGCPEGTCVDVESLFYNTPARRKFMRAPATEQAHVIEAGLRVVLGAQRGGLVVCAGNRRLLDIPEHEPAAGEVGLAEQQRERVHCALGHRLGALTPVQLEEGGVSVMGFVSEPQLSRSETRGLWIFVNGRFVRDRMLQRAVLESFAARCPQGYPTAILWLQLDPEAVDINVHPQKLEVRFADAHQVYRTIETAIAASLAPLAAEAGPVLVHTDESMRGWRAHRPQISHAQAPAFGHTSHRAAETPDASAPMTPTAELWAGSQPRVSLRPGGGVAGAMPRSAKIPFAAASQRPAWRPPANAQKTPDAQALLPALPPVAVVPKKSLPASQSFRHITPLTCVRPGFLLGRLGEHVVLVDGVQATRMLVSERLAAQFASGALLRHTLMLPPTFAAPKAWAQRLVEAGWEDWTAWGLELDCVGPDQYAVRALPQVLVGCDPIAVAQSCLDVVLRMQKLQDAASLRRCVEARWLQLVQCSALQADDSHKQHLAMQHLFGELAAAQLDIDAVSFAKRLGATDFGPLLH